MKKYAVILIVLILPLLLTGCTKKNAQNAGGGLFNANKEDKEETVSGSLMDVFKSGKSQKCTASIEKDGGKMTLEVYTSGKKMYSETKITSEDAPEMNMTMYSLVDEEWMYSWGDMTVPTKIPLSDMEAIEMGMSPEEKRENMAAQKSYQDELDYKCKPWIPDASKFKVPSNINFDDATGEMQQMMEKYNDEYMEDMKQSTCEMCESLPTQDAIDSCKAEIGC